MPFVFEEEPKKESQKDSRYVFEDEPTTIKRSVPQSFGSQVYDVMKKTPGNPVYGYETLKNVPGDAWTVAKSLYSIIRHPSQTASGMRDLAYGGLDKAVDSVMPIAEKMLGKKATDDQKSQIKQLIFQLAGEPYPTRQQADIFNKVVAEPVKQAVTHPVDTLTKDLPKYVQEHPVQAAMNVSASTGTLSKILPAGKLATTMSDISEATNIVKPIEKLAGLGLKAGKRVVSETLGVTTGSGRGAIEEAVKADPMFKKAMRGQISGEEIVDNAKDALQTLRDNRGEAYRAKLQEVRSAPGVLDKVKSGLDKELDTLIGRDDFQIEKSVDNKGKTVFDFNESPLVKNTDVVKKALSDVSDWKDNSALGLDNLKKRLSKYIDQTEHNSPARALITRLETNLSKGLKDTVQEYEKMTKGYSEATNLIKDIESNLMLRKEGMTGRITADQTLRRLSSALRENFEMRKDLLKTLGDQSHEDIISQVAGYTMSPALPRGGLAKILTGSGAYYLGAFNPKLWPILAASSPRTVGEFLSAFGKAYRFVQPTLKRAEMAGVKTAPYISTGQQIIKEPNKINALSEGTNENRQGVNYLP